MHAANLVKSAKTEIPATAPEIPAIDLPQPAGKVDQKEIDSFDRDKPLSFCLKEFEAHIRNRQAKRYRNGRWEPVTPSNFNEDYAPVLDKLRSEERRVGKESRSRGWRNSY